MQDMRAERAAQAPRQPLGIFGSGQMGLGGEGLVRNWHEAAVLGRADEVIE